MFDIGFFELVVLTVVGLVVLGPERLPGAIRTVSRTIGSVRRMASHVKQDLEQELKIQELHENLKKAEQQGLENLAPELQQSVDSLKAAAESVNQPYQSKGDDSVNDDPKR